MRYIASILAALVLAGWVACKFDVAEFQSGRDQTPAKCCVETQWRHTVDGWEKASSLFGFRSCLGEHPAALPHPIVFALLVALASTLALLAFSPATPTNKRNQAGNSRKFAETTLRSRLWLDPLA